MAGLHGVLVMAVQEAETHMEKHFMEAAANTFNLSLFPLKWTLLIMEMTEWECELLCVNNKHSHGLESRWALHNGVLTHGRARRKCSSLKIEPFPFSF